MIINSSRGHTARSCPAKYCLNYELNIVPKKKAVPLMTGGAVHVGLAGWYASGNIDIALGMFEGKYREETKGFWIGEEQEIVEKEIAYGKYMLREYAKQYPSEHWEMARPESKFKVVLGEHCYVCEAPYDRQWQLDVKKMPNELASQSECLTCGAPIHILVGTADLLVTWKGGLWIVEHKTTKQAASNWIESFQRATQPSAYVYGMSKSLGHRVKGVLLNALKKTKVPDYIRDIFLRSAKQLNWFVKDTIEICNDIIRWKAQGWWQQYTEECYHWGRCPYIPLCNRYEEYHTIPLEEILPLGYEIREPDYGDAQYIQEEKRT